MALVFVINFSFQIMEIERITEEALINYLFERQELIDGLNFRSLNNQ